MLNVSSRKEIPTLNTCTRIMSTVYVIRFTNYADHLGKNIIEKYM